MDWIWPKSHSSLTLALMCWKCFLSPPFSPLCHTPWHPSLIHHVEYCLVAGSISSEIQMSALPLNSETSLSFSFTHCTIGITVPTSLWLARIMLLLGRWYLENLLHAWHCLGLGSPWPHEAYSPVGDSVLIRILLVAGDRKHSLKWLREKVSFLFVVVAFFWFVFWLM